MKNSLLFFVITILLSLILLLAGLIGAIFRLINIPAILIALIIIIVISNQKGWYWWKLLLRNSSLLILKNSPNNFFPASRKQAARKSLKSIDKLIERIQDSVEAESLMQERKRIEEEFNRGDLYVVIFGTGSSGKTAIVRALLRRMVGIIDVGMGSTKKSERYKLRLKGLKRSLQIIDTPGILEGGNDGRLREKESLTEASRADLIIVIIDTDLRALEMSFISSFKKVGKKILLVLNKCDLRTEREEQKLLSIIKKQCYGLIESKNILSCCAAPQSIPIKGRRPFQPQPEINNLIRSMASILHEEGEELIADNILLQCKNIGEAGKQLLNEQRFTEAVRCIDKYAWIGSGVVIVNPLPGIDLLGTAAVNTRMVMEIAEVYGIRITRSRAQELAISVGRTLAGLGIVKGGLSIISNSLSLSLPTLAVGKVIQGVTAAWLIKIAGSSFITYFAQDQEWGDGGIQEIVQRHFKLNSREAALEKFIRNALARVVEPIENDRKKQLPPYLRPQEEEDS